jgi:aminoglycoside 6'-N-acetyltransferase
MFTFRPLTARDFPLLARWRNSPHVAAWWDGPTDLEGFRAQYEPRLSADSLVRMFVVERDGVPFGRIQYEPTYGWLPDFAEDVANIDFLIGSADHIGQGLGPRMIKEFIERVVLKDGRFARVVSDPAVANRRSVRALEKAGFRSLETRRINDGDYLIMEWSGVGAD